MNDSGIRVPCAKCGQAGVVIGELAIELVNAWNSTHSSSAGMDPAGLCDECHRLWLASRRETQARYTKEFTAAWREYKSKVGDMAQSFTPREAIDRGSRNLAKRWQDDPSFVELKSRWDAWFCGKRAPGNSKRGTSY